jgi:hypothetical protein
MIFAEVSQSKFGSLGNNFVANFLRFDSTLYAAAGSATVFSVIEKSIFRCYNNGNKASKVA